MLSLLPTAAPAVDITNIEVTRDGDTYGITVEARLDADAESAFGVMAAFELLPRINPSVKKVQRLATASEGEDVYTEVRLCVALVCKLLWQVQNMRIERDATSHTLTAIVNPKLSNLRMGRASWRFDDCEPQYTCLSFQAELVPDFWVPPLIGPWVIKRTMREQAITTSEGIERMARVPAAP